MPYKNKEDKVANDKAYNKANKERIKVKSKAWYEANKESKREASKVWNEANKERALEISRSWKAVNKEKVKAHYRSWGKANPEKINAKSSRRRAHKLNLIPKHFKKCPVEKQRVLVIYKLCLLISKATGVQHHVDHMWPLSRGGPEWSGNMQIITAQENLSKNAKLCPELKRNIRQSLMEITNDI
jgi:hypothetical protein